MYIHKTQSISQYQRIQQQSVFKKRKIKLHIKKGPAEEGKGNKVDVYV